MYKAESSEILEVIDNYFNGIFYGDTEKLMDTFHPDALLFGEIKGVPYQKSVPEYIDGVKNRKSPSDLNEAFGMKVLGIDVSGHVAYVKTHSPMLGFNYYDHLSLLKHNGRWRIVSKVFSHVDV